VGTVTDLEELEEKLRHLSRRVSFMAGAATELCGAAYTTPEGKVGCAQRVADWEKEMDRTIDEVRKELRRLAK
jgi:hypothetical protein